MHAVQHMRPNFLLDLLRNCPQVARQIIEYGTFPSLLLLSLSQSELGVTGILTAAAASLACLALHAAVGWCVNHSLCVHVVLAYHVAALEGAGQWWNGLMYVCEVYAGPLSRGGNLSSAQRCWAAALGYTPRHCR